MSDNNILTKLKRYHHRLNGSTTEYDLSAYEIISDEIHELNPEFENKSDHQLKRMSQLLREKAQKIECLDDLLPHAYALVREAIRRVLCMNPFDVQLLGGIVMHWGKIAEMQTGEGKTLTAVFPAYLNALTGHGVHILTFNDYLAKRDAQWMGPVYNFLGMTVGYIQEGMKLDERKQAYYADITYVTAKEAGFDYLRTFLCYDKSEVVHGPFHFALIDEADSILIDEARIPLVIAGNVDPGETAASKMASVTRNLIPDVDFDTDEYKRTIFLTDKGLEKAEQLLDEINLYEEKNICLLTALNNALHAENLLHRDVDYLIRNSKVEFVDEFTGRIVKDRHWPDGLQAAIEAKEGVLHHDGGSILGSITLQHFLQLYPKICGMTATAQQSAEEIKRFYNLDVVVIPPNRECIRLDRPDIIFTHKETKESALVEEIMRVHSSGRPVLVGTLSVEESEQFANALKRAGLSCRILNAKRNEWEAKIISNAGSIGAITISTNMAGRGTDIKLGGPNEEERERVVALGGLYVIGTNRHESRRIDDQLRGRAGRQGDPGESRFFISLEDDLIVQYGIDNLIPKKLRPHKQDKAVDNPVIRSEIARAQRIIEGQNLEIRKTLCNYSDLIEKQRILFQKRRQDILFGKQTLSVFETKLPGLYKRLSNRIDKTVLQETERLITLYHMESCWTEHLAQIAQIREGIHLARLGGLNPLDEFYKTVTAAFDDIQEKLDDEIIKTLKRVTITDNGIDMDKEGLRGPSSTWTYLISDDAFTNTISRLIGEQGGPNSGFATVAAFFWPLLLISAAIQKFVQRRKGRSM